MIEVSEELVEAVVSGQKLVLITQVVLPKLSARVTERLEKFRNSRVFGAQADIRAGRTHLGESCADGLLPSDESGTASGAALLRIPAVKQRAFFGNAVDVRGLVPHHAAAVTTRVKPADIIAHDDKDVRLLGLLLLRINNIRYGGYE